MTENYLIFEISWRKLDTWGVFLGFLGVCVYIYVFIKSIRVGRKICNSWLWLCFQKNKHFLLFFSLGDGMLNLRRTKVTSRRWNFSTSLRLKWTSTLKVNFKKKSLSFAANTWKDSSVLQHQIGHSLVYVSKTPSDSKYVN